MFGSGISMCGLVGIATKSSERLNAIINRNKYVAVDMAEKVHHRGPDDSSVLVTNQAILSFKRLAIVGGATARQPISNERKSIHLVCNGEIFNHKELTELLTESHTFSTTSDCEVIIHLYEERGIEVLALLEGQFSFALLDEGNGELYLARDKFGITPLHYMFVEGDLYFASEIKALFVNGSMPESLNASAIYETAVLYGPTPPRTNFKNVYQVPPAHFLRWNTTVGAESLHEYWQLPTQHNENYVLSHEEVYHLIDMAVQRRLQGVSEHGIYLSGGIDSSVVGYFLAKSSSFVKGFGITFEEESIDESLFQKEIAQFLGIPLKSVVFRSEHIWTNICEAIWHAEAPITRSAPIPMLMLSKLVRENGIKVALCGEGADELFAGYPIFHSGYSSVESKYESTRRVRGLFKEKYRHSMVDIDLRAQFTASINSEEVDRLSISQAIEYKTKLSRYLLSSQGDRMSMASSVEQRYPFLDTQLIEAIMRLPKNNLSGKGITKAMLREALRDKLPHTILARPKQGYIASTAFNIFDQSGLSINIDEFINRRAIDEAGVFDPQSVNGLIRQCKHSSGAEIDRTFMESAFWLVLSTQILFALYVKGESKHLYGKS